MEPTKQFSMLLDAFEPNPLLNFEAEGERKSQVSRIYDAELVNSVIQVKGLSPSNCFISTPKIKIDAPLFNLPVLNIYLKKSDGNVSFDIEVLDNLGEKVVIKSCTFTKKPRISGSIARIPSQLVKGWNFMSIDLRSIIPDLFKNEFVAFLQLKIYPVCAIGKVFFSDGIYESSDTPTEFILDSAKSEDRQNIILNVDLKPMRGIWINPTTPAASTTTLHKMNINRIIIKNIIIIDEKKEDFQTPESTEISFIVNRAYTMVEKIYSKSCSGDISKYENQEADDVAEKPCLGLNQNRKYLFDTEHSDESSSTSDVTLSPEEDKSIDDIRSCSDPSTAVNVPVGSRDIPNIFREAKANLQKPPKSFLRFIYNCYNKEAALAYKHKILNEKFDINNPPALCDFVYSPESLVSTNSNESSDELNFEYKKEQNLADIWQDIWEAKAEYFMAPSKNITKNEQSYEDVKFFQQNEDMDTFDFGYFDAGSDKTLNMDGNNPIDGNSKTSIGEAFPLTLSQLMERLENKSRYTDKDIINVGCDIENEAYYKEILWATLEAGTSSEDEATSPTKYASSDEESIEKRKKF